MLCSVEQTQEGRGGANRKTSAKLNRSICNNDSHNCSPPIFSPRRFTASSFVTNKAALQRSAVATNALYQQQKTAASSSLNMVLKDPTDTDVAIGGGGGMFTASNSENRRVVPENAGDRPVMKVVYVVLESQYQSSMTGAVKRINAGSENMAVECVGYLLEELRDDATFEQFKKDVEEANIFIGSLIFVQELAEKVTEVVKPLRDQLDAVLVFPSMPEVMRLNKVGSFTMKNLGQSKSVVADFMKKKKQDDGSSFEEGMLKLLRTLPKVLKFLPSDKAADARTFMMSFQYWLGGECNHIYMYLLVLVCFDFHVVANPAGKRYQYDTIYFLNLIITSHLHKYI